MSAGPTIDPLASPKDETEEFLVKLSMAYQDIHEDIANWTMNPYRESSVISLPPTSIWNPKPGPVYR